jgi:hypothetical protein
MSGLRRFTRRWAAAVVAAAMLVGLSAGGQRWFRCGLDAQVRSACCCGSDDASPVGASAPELAKLKRSCCCEVLTTVAVRQLVTEAHDAFRISVAPRALVLPVLPAWAAMEPARASSSAAAGAPKIDVVVFPVLLRKQSLLI